MGRDGWISTRTLVDAILGTIGPEEEDGEEGDGEEDGEEGEGEEDGEEEEGEEGD
jgi:hypothetical protein